jgi:hypothetical protein
MGGDLSPEILDRRRIDNPLSSAATGPPYSATSDKPGKNLAPKAIFYLCRVRPIAVRRLSAICCHWHALSNGHSNVGSAQSTDLRASTVFVTSTANRTFASRARPSSQCPLQGNYHECSTAYDQRSHSKWRLTHWPAAINLGPEPLCFRSPVK